MIKVVYCDIIRLILPYFPTVFTNIYYLFPLNSMTLPSQGGDEGEVFHGLFAILVMVTKPA